MRRAGHISKKEFNGLCRNLNRLRASINTWLKMNPDMHETLTDAICESYYTLEKDKAEMPFPSYYILWCRDLPSAIDIFIDRPCFEVYGIMLIHLQLLLIAVKSLNIEKKITFTRAKAEYPAYEKWFADALGRIEKNEESTAPDSGEIRAYLNSMAGSGKEAVSRQGEDIYLRYRNVRYNMLECRICKELYIESGVIDKRFVDSPYATIL